MKIFLDRYEDQVVNAGDMHFKVDQKKLIKWLKHMIKLNDELMRDLDRSDVQRGIDKGRFSAYSSILNCIKLGTIITK